MKNDGMGEGVQGEGAQDGRAKRETHTERGREREAAGRDGIKNGCLFIHNFLFHSEGPAARRRTAQISPLHKSRERRGGGGDEVRSGEGRGGHGREYKGGGGDQAGDG